MRKGWLCPLVLLLSPCTLPAQQYPATAYNPYGYGAYGAAPYAYGQQGYYYPNYYGYYPTQAYGYPAYGYPAAPTQPNANATGVAPAGKEGGEATGSAAEK